jgi:hypothetical protein
MDPPPLADLFPLPDVRPTDISITLLLLMLFFVMTSSSIVKLLSLFSIDDIRYFAPDPTFPKSHQRREMS